MRVDFNAKIKPIRPINKGFTLCKCYVLALGKNRNKSNITEEVVNDALSTLYNIPVVGHIYVDENGKYFMGGHDVKLERDKDGKFKFQVLTVPYGVVPETNNVSFEEVKEASGETKTYVTADIILWTGRYPELGETIYNENLFWGQSMEIEALEVSRSKDDSGFVDINKFAFSGLCLLGKSDDENYHYEPCFPEARVEPYRFTIDDGFAARFEDMKKELALCFSKGGYDVKDEKKDDAIKKETVGFKIESEPAQKETKAETIQTEPPAEAVFQFAATYNGKREAIGTALGGMTKSTDEAFLKYYLADFDEKYVYVEQLFADSQNPDGKWTKGRMAYSMNADETAAVNEASFETMLVKWMTVPEAAALEKQREDLAALTAYKAEHQAADKKRGFETVLEEFCDLHDDEGFKELKGKMLNFSSEDELKKELFAMRGMKVNAQPEMKFAVGEVKQKTAKQELHDEFMDTYLKKV